MLQYSNDTDFFSGLEKTALYATAAMPGTSMRIYYGEPIEGAIAENVKIGDPLTLVVSIDDQVRGCTTTHLFIKMNIVKDRIH